ncbi:MAG TPA: hypothetical protein VHL09_08310 [Dehalococcoidia bacterium]|nr:hypothetical protein [Dehalococcoidia bacterium]
MPITVIIHVAGEEAVVGELADLPGPTDTTILANNVRRRDGKAVHYLAPGVTTVIWPIDRLTFVEVVPPRQARPEGQSPEPAQREPAPEPRLAPPPAPLVAATPPPQAEPEPEPPPRVGGVLTQRRAQSGPPRPGGPPLPPRSS